MKQYSQNDRPSETTRPNMLLDRRCFLGAMAAGGVINSTAADTPELAWPDELSFGPFRYHADYPLASDTKLLQHIAGLHQELPTELRIKKGSDHIHVYLFSRQSTYEKYLARYFKDVPNRRALFIKQGGPGMVFAYRSRDFATDVRHETTHAVLHNALPMVPLWIDEGLAEYFEVPRDDRQLKNPHMRKVIRDTNKHKLPSLSKLEQITDLSKMGATEYREAFAWMHFSLHGPKQARDVLQSHLDEIAQRRPAGRFADRMRRAMPDVEYQFFAHYRRHA